MFEGPLWGWEAPQAILLIFSKGFMRIAKPRRRRSTQSDLVNRAWLTIETSAELIEERRAQAKELERFLDADNERAFRNAFEQRKQSPVFGAYHSLKSPAI